VFDNSEEWKLYQQGLDYNTKLNIYTNTELYWDFYNGKQYNGVVTNGNPKMMFNICKSAINYFIAFICSSKVKMQYSAENIPDDPTDENDAKVKKFTDLLSNMADMKWEKDKMDSKLRQLMLDGGCSGDFAAHVWWDSNKETGQNEKGDFATEIVDGINVMFGNPNNKDVESQPYILIVGREMVSKLKEEADDNGISQDLIDSITADSDTQYQAGSSGKIELDSKEDNGKCNYIIKYYKKNGEVLWNKSTKTCPIIKERKAGRKKGELTEETKITRYPIAFGNWDSVKNSYHGIPPIDGIIDNQIVINQLFSMVALWMKKMAFGSMVVDGNAFPDGISNKLGQVFKTNGAGNPKDLIHQLEAGNFNRAILTVIDMAIKYTKDFIGANDALMGQVNPEQASGTAIIATQKQAAMPLGNISANRDQFVEDLGLIWGEFFLKKYNNRKVSYKENEKVVVSDYSTDGMDKILLNCKVDVGASSYWSEIVGIQALDRLLNDGHITKLQYFNRIAKMGIIPDVQGLIREAQEEMAMLQQQAQQQAQQQQAAQQQQDIQGQQIAQQNAQFEQMAEWLKNQPQEVQQQIMSLPSEEEQQQAIIQMMGGT
jgi:hypothetical protein